MPTAPLVLALVLASQAPAKPFISEVGGFRVAMPAEPKEKVQSVQTAVGPIDLHLFAADLGDAFYAAGYADYPEAVALSDPDRVLEGAVEGSMKSTRATLRAKRSIDLAGHPGREFEADIPSNPDDPVISLQRVYLVGTRLYQVILVGRTSKIEGEGGASFLRSFALLKPPPPPKAKKPLAPGKPFASEQGRFRIGFPEAPRERTQEIPSPPGPIQLHVFIVDRGDIAYCATYNDFEADLKNFDPDAALEGVIRASLAGIKGELLTKRDIRVDDHPGKAFEAKGAFPDGRPATYRARIYLVEKRLYQVVMTATDVKDDPKAAGAFLQSFALLKPPTP